jgi:hypothetical protein
MTTRLGPSPSYRRTDRQSRCDAVSDLPKRNRRRGVADEHEAHLLRLGVS